MADSLVTTSRPAAITVLYDGQCRFCRGQIALLRRCDVGRQLRFLSVHDPLASREFAELDPQALMREMHVVDTSGRVRAGAESVRFLARRLPLLWPLALPLHVPGSLPLWNWLYGLVARNRYRLAGTCDDGSCRLP